MVHVKMSHVENVMLECHMLKFYMLKCQVLKLFMSYVNNKDSCLFVQSDNPCCLHGMIQVMRKLDYVI